MLFRSYTCEYCDKQFTVKNAFLTHQNSCNEKIIFDRINKVINNHTLDKLDTNHHYWYSRLNDKNRKYVRNELKPIIDKYTGK